MTKAEIDEIIRRLKEQGSYSFRASRTVELQENGEVHYNYEGLHMREFRDTDHFGAWLACGHNEDEHTRPIREYEWNPEEGDEEGEHWKLMVDNTLPVSISAITKVEASLFETITDVNNRQKLCIIKSSINGLETATICIQEEPEKGSDLQMVTRPLAVLIVSEEIMDLVKPMGEWTEQ